MESINEIIKQVDVNGNVYEVAIVKESKILNFIIDVEANKTLPYNLNANKLKFPHGFLITQITTQAETNALASFLLNIADKYFPSAFYFLDASNALAMKSPLTTYARGFYATNTVPTYFRDLNIEIKKDEFLKFYVYNSHTSAQELYIQLIGFKTFTRVIKPIS